MNIAENSLSRYLTIGCVSLTGVLTLFFLQWALEGTWSVEEGQRVLSLSAQFLPVPFAFLFWVRLMEQSKPFKLVFSPFFCALSVEAFTAMQVLVEQDTLRQIVFAAGVFFGLFVLVPFRECVRCAIRQPKATAVALVAAMASCNYYWLMQTIWAEMAGWAAKAVFAILQLFNLKAYAVIHPRVNTTIFIHSDAFTIWVNKGCNGLEGIFLFTFLLSIIFLLDWELFRRMPILALYILGIVYMFCLNVLRITSLFIIGYFAYQRNASHLMQSFRGLPLYMFHSYVGWAYYLFAFGIFAAVLYRIAGRNRNAEFGIASS